MRPSVVVVVVVVICFVVATTVACEECRNLTDCPVGELCTSDGQCIPEPPLPGEGEGEGEGEAGEGEGEGEGVGEGEGEGEGELPCATLGDPFVADAVYVLGTVDGIDVGLGYSRVDQPELYGVGFDPAELESITHYAVLLESGDIAYARNTGDAIEWVRYRSDLHLPDADGVCGFNADPAANEELIVSMPSECGLAARIVAQGGGDGDGYVTACNDQVSGVVWNDETGLRRLEDGIDRFPEVHAYDGDGNVLGDIGGVLLIEARDGTRTTVANLEGAVVAARVDRDASGGFVVATFENEFGGADGFGRFRAFDIELNGQTSLRGEYDSVDNLPFLIDNQQAEYVLGSQERIVIDRNDNAYAQVFGGALTLGVVKFPLDEFPELIWNGEDGYAVSLNTSALVAGP